MLAVAAIMASFLVVVALFGTRTERVEAGPAIMPTIAAPVRTTSVAVIGDSYTACSGMGGCDAANYTESLRASTGWKFTPFAEGGTGYANAGAGTTFSQRVDGVIATSPDIVIVEGGRNDIDLLDALPAATQDTLSRLRAGLPEAKIVVVGPIYTPTADLDSVTEARDIIARSAQDAGANVFIDPLAAEWFAGLDAQYIGADGVHPTDAGHKYIAEKLLPVMNDLGI